MAKPESLPDFKGKVSVIICAHNEVENLKKGLQHVLDQDYPDFEVILVNDRSTDKTAEWLNSIQHKNLFVVNISATPEGWNNKKYALDQGISKATGEVILLTDADCIPISKNWLNGMCQGMTSKQITIGYSPYKTYPGFLNNLIRFETLYTAIQYFSLGVAGAPYMGTGRNLGYKKSLFTERKGFSKIKGVTGGDDDLFINLIATKSNTLFKWDLETHVMSEPKRTLKSWFKQKKRHLNAGKFYSFKFKLILGFLSLSQIFFYPIAILGLIFNPLNLFIILLILLRTLFIIVIFAAINRKLKDQIKWYLIPFLEICNMLMYIFVGISVLFSRNIRWT